MGVSQLFPTFLHPCKDEGAPSPGEFFWVPTPELGFHVVEATRATPAAHTTVDFKLAVFDARRHYREKDHLPVKLLHLDESSECQ